MHGSSFIRQTGISFLEILDKLSSSLDIDSLLEATFEHIFKYSHVTFVGIVYFSDEKIIPLGYAYKSQFNNKITTYIDSWLLDKSYCKSAMNIRYRRTHRALPIILNDGVTNIGILYVGFSLEIVNPQLLNEIVVIAKLLAIRLQTLLFQKKEEELIREIDRINVTNKENIRLLYDISKQLYAITAISTCIGEGLSYYSFFKKIESKIMAIFGCDAMLILWGPPSKGNMKIVFKGFSIRKDHIKQILDEIMKKITTNFHKPTIVDMTQNHFEGSQLKQAFKKVVLGPLSIKGVVKGYLVLVHKDHREYGNDTMRLLSGISSILATTLENIILYNQTRRERSKLRFLLDSISHFTETLDLGETLKSIAMTAATILGSNGTIILMSRSKVPLLMLSKVEGKVQEINVYETIEVSSFRYLLRYFESTKRAMLIRDAKRTQKIPQPIIKALKPMGIFSILGVPLKLKSEQLGVLLLCGADRNKRFSAEDLELAKGLADAAAISLRNSQIYSSAQEFSSFLEKKIIERESPMEQGKKGSSQDSENTELLVFRLNLKGYFIFVNRTMELKTGYDRHLFYTGKINPLDLVVEEDRHKLKSVIRSILRGHADRIENVEFTISNSKSERIILSMNIYPDKDPNGKIVGLEAICNDVTVKKRVEEELRRSKELALLGEFSGAIAHQIRNPLSQIYMGLRRMQLSVQDLFQPNSDNQKAYVHCEEFLKIINDSLENSKYLERMISDVLNYTKTLRVCLTSQSLIDILKEAVEDFIPMASQRNISISLEENGQVPLAEVDAVLLGQSFRNIIQNSLEAMENGGTLSIDLTLVQGQSNYAKVVFKDTGKGIPKEYLGRIFHPFFTTKAQGTGLGLSFASKVIAAHRGSIWAESDGKKGATIIVLLPLQKKPRE